MSLWIFPWIYLFQEFNILLIQFNRRPFRSIVIRYNVAWTGYKFHLIISLEIAISNHNDDNWNITKTRTSCVVSNCRTYCIEVRTCGRTRREVAVNYEVPPRYSLFMCNFAGMGIRFCACFLVMVVVLLLPSEIEPIAVMSVDLGSEWMKIAIVSVIMHTILYNCVCTRVFTV
jgi:hypothetical protein